jgi:hypothetical protein
MRALVLKDLRVLRPWWWLIVPAHLLFGANGIVAPQLFFAMNVALAWTYTILLLIVDWTQEADRYVASLPVSRRDMVQARYVGALGAALGGTVLYALYGRVLMAFATERLLARWPGTPGWESVEGLLTFFMAVWLVSMAYLPFYFRSGLGKGSWLFVAILAPVIVVGAVLVRWLSLPGPPGGVSGVLGTAGTVVVALALAATLGWLSLRLSVRFFDRRDL